MYLDNTSVEKYCGAEFGPFGESLYERGVSNYIPFRLYGMYKDVETGLYYNVRRYYDWRVGRYL
jgi:RHS repeat-associated protein